MASSDKLNNRLRKAGDVRSFYSPGGNPDIPIFYTGAIFDVQMSTPETRVDGEKNGEIPLENYVTINKAITIISKSIGNEIDEPDHTTNTIYENGKYKNADGKSVSDIFVNLKQYITSIRVHESLAGIDFEKSKSKTKKKSPPKSKKTARIIKVPPGKNAEEDPSTVVSFSRVPFKTFDEHIFGALLNGRVDKKTGKVKKDSSATQSYMKILFTWALGHSIDNDTPSAVSKNNKYELEGHFKMIRNIKIDGGTKTVSFEMVAIPKSTYKEKVVYGKGVQPYFKHDELVIDALNNTVAGIPIENFSEIRREVEMVGNSIPESTLEGKPIIEMTMQELFDYSPVKPNSGYTLSNGKHRGKKLLQLVTKGIDGKPLTKTVYYEEKGDEYDKETLTKMNSQKDVQFFTNEDYLTDEIKDAPGFNKYTTDYGRRTTPLEDAVGNAEEVAGWVDEGLGDYVIVSTKRVTETIIKHKEVPVPHYKWTNHITKNATYETFTQKIAERIDGMLITRFGIPAILGPNMGQDKESPEPKRNGESVRWIKDLDYRGVFKVPGLIDTKKSVSHKATGYQIKLDGKTFSNHSYKVREQVKEYFKEHFKYVTLTEANLNFIEKEITSTPFKRNVGFQEQVDSTNPEPKDESIFKRTDIVGEGYKDKIHVLLTVPLTQCSFETNEFKKTKDGHKVPNDRWWGNQGTKKKAKKHTVTGKVSGPVDYPQYPGQEELGAVEISGKFIGGGTEHKKVKMRFTKHLPVICAISPNNQNIWEIRSGFDTGEFDYETKDGKEMIKASSGAVWYGSVDWDVDWTRYMEADITPILDSEDKKQITSLEGSLRRSLYYHQNTKGEWVLYTNEAGDKRPSALERLVALPDDYARFRDYVRKVYNLKLMDTTDLNTPEQIDKFFTNANKSLPFAVRNNESEAQQLSAKQGKGVFSDDKLVFEFQKSLRINSKHKEELEGTTDTEKHKALKAQIQMEDKHLYDIFIDEWVKRDYKGSLNAEITASKRARGITKKSTWSSGFDISPIRAYIKDLAGNGLLYSGGLIHIPDVGNLSGLYRIQTVDHVWMNNRWQSELAVLWDDNANKLVETKGLNDVGDDTIIKNDLASKGWRVRDKK